METQQATRTNKIQSFDGTMIEYEIRDNQGPTLIFVHGWCCNRAFWASQLQEFSTDFKTIAIDLAGHGRSDEGRDDNSLKNFAKDIIAVVDHLELTDFILIGHSMGGGVVLEAARKLGNKIRKIIVVDTFVFDYGQFTSDQVQGFLDSFGADFAGAMQGLVKQTCKPDTETTFINNIAEQMAQTDNVIGLSALKGLLTWDPSPVWGDIQAPISCINGDMISADARKRHEGRFKEHLLPDTGHFLQIEAPERFNNLLSTVLSV